MGDHAGSATHYRAKLLCALLLSGMAALCLCLLHELTFIRTTVINETNAAAFEAPELPGFIKQKPQAPKLVTFRKNILPLSYEGNDEFARAIDIQHWVRGQESDKQFYWQPGQKVGPEIDHTEDPQEYLDQQRRGTRSACRRFAYIFTGALLSVGTQARIVSVSNSLSRSNLAHNLVEVRIEARHKWVLFDPTLDAVVLVNDHPASVMEVYRAAKSGSPDQITFDQHGAHYRQPPIGEYKSYFGHLFFARTNAVFDGYRYELVGRKRIEFVHYVGPGTKPYPQRRKVALLLGCAVASVCGLLLSLQCLVQLTLAGIASSQRVTQITQIPWVLPVFANIRAAFFDLPLPERLLLFPNYTRPNQFVRTKAWGRIRTLSEVSRNASN